MLSPKASILTKVNNNLPNNTVQFISPAKERDVFYDLVDSFANLIDDKILFNTRDFTAVGRVYEVGEAVFFGGQLYRTNTVHSGAWNASHFDAVGGGTVTGANNGLALSGGDVVLGGFLDIDTTIDLNSKIFSFDGIGGVNIGTTFNLEILTVNGNISFTDRGQKLMFINDGGVYIERPVGSDTLYAVGEDILIESRNAATSTNMLIANRFMVTDVSSNYLLCINVADGYVGFGTDVPVRKLELNTGDGEIPIRISGMTSASTIPATSGAKKTLIVDEFGDVSMSNPNSYVSRTNTTLITLTASSATLHNISVFPEDNLSSDGGEFKMNTFITVNSASSHTINILTPNNTQSFTSAAGTKSYYIETYIVRKTSTTYDKFTKIFETTGQTLVATLITNNITANYASSFLFRINGTSGAGTVWNSYYMNITTTLIK